MPMMSYVTSPLMSQPIPKPIKGRALCSLIYNKAKFQRVYINLLVNMCTDPQVNLLFFIPIFDYSNFIVSSINQENVVNVYLFLWSTILH